MAVKGRDCRSPSDLSKILSEKPFCACDISAGKILIGNTRILGEGVKHCLLAT